MSATAVLSGRSGALLLLSIIAIALAVRLVGLDRRTLTHPELFVPGIALPEYATTPATRDSLHDVVVETLRRDIHPPGYYIGMWFWTMLFGTSVFAMRLPAALIGTATVWLLYRFAKARFPEASNTRGVAWIAAALLAVHGHHVLWSQQARMWVFLPFIALLTVELRDAIARELRASTAIAYVLVAALGLWFEYSFWIFFAAHMLREFFQSARAERLPATVELQLLAVALASPALGYLWIDLERGAGSFLENADIAHHLTGFLAMQWLVGGSLRPETFSSLVSQGILVLFAVSSALLVAGIVADWSRRASAAVPIHAPIPWRGRLACALAPMLFAVLWLRDSDETTAFAISCALPGLVIALTFALERSWPSLSVPWQRFVSRLKGQQWSADATTFHALTPIVMALLLSIAVPSVAPRSLLITLPFSLLLVARGVAMLPGVVIRGVAMAALLAACVLSIGHYSQPGILGINYKALAEQMNPHTGDTILIQNDWWALPMHYYLPAVDFRTGNYDDEGQLLLTDPSGTPDRVWLVAFGTRDADDVAASSASLRHHRVTRREEVSGGVAFLLERATAVPGKRARPRS